MATQPTPVILAPHAHPDFGGRAPACLHPVLGDPSLLWVLRALPPGESAVIILHGDPEVPEAVADWTARGLLPRPAECHFTEATAPEPMLLDFSERLARIPEGIGLCFGDAPLVEPAHLTLGLEHHPLQWPILESALQSRTALAEAIPMDSPWRTVLASLRLTRRWNLPELTRRANQRITEGWMARGVSIPDPDSVTIGPRVTLSPDVQVASGVRLEGHVSVGEGSQIGQGCQFRDCVIGRRTEIRPYCVGQGAAVGDRVKLGPFAHLREGTVLEEDVHVGNFVETKKATLRKGAKANHLSYLGDAEIGERTNIGAGCITCNYDGVRKHFTRIGREVFLGSDCQLIAPLEVGDGALIAAGTTLTTDVPPDALAIARPELRIKPDGATRLKARFKTKTS